MMFANLFIWSKKPCHLGALLHEHNTNRLKKKPPTIILHKHKNRIVRKTRGKRSPSIIYSRRKGKKTSPPARLVSIPRKTLFSQFLLFQRSWLTAAWLKRVLPHVRNSSKNLLRPMNNVHVIVHTCEYNEEEADAAKNGSPFSYLVITCYCRWLSIPFCIHDTSYPRDSRRPCMHKRSYGVIAMRPDTPSCVLLHDHPRNTPNRGYGKTGEAQYSYLLTAPWSIWRQRQSIHEHMNTLEEHSIQYPRLWCKWPKKHWRSWQHCGALWYLNPPSPAFLL